MTGIVGIFPEKHNLISSMDSENLSIQIFILRTSAGCDYTLLASFNIKELFLSSRLENSNILSIAILGIIAVSLV